MKLLSTLLVCSCLLLSSCNQEEVLTDGERSAQQVQSILSANQGIRTASFYVDNSRIEFNVSFSISGQYIITANNSYNLSQLIRYQYGSQGITFYF